MNDNLDVHLQSIVIVNFVLKLVYDIMLKDKFQCFPQAINPLGFC